MTNPSHQSARLLLYLVSLLGLNAFSQLQLPNEVGTTVNGFQDDFDGTTLQSKWVVAGANVFSVSGGALHVASAAGDPNHLLYEQPGYDNAVQEVLARIRVVSYGAGDLVRGGVGVGIDPASTRGINYLLRENTSDGQSAMHLAFLDDLVEWGPVQSFVWQTNTWYWMRLRQEPNAAAWGGQNDVFGKIWLADGAHAEPAGWQLTWDYTPGEPERTGYAGITASSGGSFQFDVDYILIKAAGLPSIVVQPNGFVQVPASITNQPQSQTVAELAPASFSVGAGGNPAPSFQWFRDGNVLAGATNATYTLSAGAYTDNGASFRVVVQNVVSNLTCTATSGVAVLTVIADTNPPVLVAAQPLGLSEVQASFSERITPAGATNLNNFSVSGTNGPVPILKASLDGSQTNVVLTVGSMTDGATYTLTVNNLTDQSHAANVIQPNSQVQFVATAYAQRPIGAPVPSGGQVTAGNGYDITAGGAAVGGTNDQCEFSYQFRTGDFDVMVRLDSLGLADAWSEAGLMAREDLTPGALSASVLATPSISGAFFVARSATNGPASVSGSFPVNYPNTWLRLKRAGNVLSGFGGFDGQNWTQLGSVTLALPAGLYFGFVVSSHNTNQVTTAAFRDFLSVTIAGTNGALSSESLGQCSRRTSLAISEIMYHPTNSSLEFVELFNSRGESQDLSGYQLGGSISYTFPPGTEIDGGGFVVVGRSPADLENAYGLGGVLGPYTNHLPNSQGTVQLVSQAGAVLLEVDYDTVPPWPVSPDGAGHSLALAHPSYGENDAQAWAASDAVGGSPGRLEPVSSDPLREVVINEFLAHTPPGELNFVELFNRGAQPLDLSGCSLNDDAKVNKFIVPQGTTIRGRGFLVYDQNQLGFGLDAAGGTLYWRNAAGTRVLDAVRYEPQRLGVSFGRVPDGAATLRALAQPTPGASNSPARRDDIVINEIMYAPISLNEDDQYVELYNRGTNTVDLSGWQFVAGISFTFPSNTVVSPDGYFVVARNAQRMLANYPNLNATNLAGNYGGKLSHHGQRIALAMPEPVVALDSQGVWTTNTVYPVENEVTYQVGGRWGQWSDAGGSSLELIDPRADNSLAPNWADSDESHKGAWTVISATGTIDNGDVPADELQVLLQGAGEALVDNVQVLDASGNNRISDGTFESGVGGWVAEGTEKTSSLETSEGYNSRQSYHVRAVEKGDNQVNRVRRLLSTPLASGTTNVTLRAAVRWVKGDPEILLRLRGNWLECAAELPTPPNLGTPGMRNSRFVSNAPPAIVEVQHAPILPDANQAVVVTAQVSDPDGVGAVLLNYRLDPSPTYTTVRMVDDGTGRDAVAGDGIWSATIAGQPAGTMMAYYIKATDAAAAPATGNFPNDAPARECLVRAGEQQPTGNFPVYRLWMTQASFNTWNQNNRLDNSFNDVTFVLGDQRVIYNSGARFKGSPYISPGYCGPACGRCGYSISFPADDPFLGEEELVFDWPGGHGGETTALQEQMCYWIADRLGLPWSHRHTIRLHVNGVTDAERQATFEAVVQPAGGFVKEWSPNDSDGQLFKIERAFEFTDGDGLEADPEPRLQIYTTTGGVKKREHYRWNFMFRATELRDNYTNLLALVDAVNAGQPEPYTSGILGLVDVEEWMGIFATEHIIENFDAYGHEIGKNMYAYLPPSGKWQLYMFDLDWAMLAAPIYSSMYAASAGPLFNADDPTITRMYAWPPFARAYWRAVRNAVDGPLDPANCFPVIDAKSRSLLANGIAWCDGQPLTDPTAVKTWFVQRRAALQAQLATVAAPFQINSVVVSNNVAVVRGTAPIDVQSLWFNGASWPLVWSSVSNWTATVVLAPGTNQWTVVGVDAHVEAVAGATATASAVYAGGAPSPVGQVVINEIMFNPAVAGAEYVELFNRSATASFDVSGWQFKGLSYSFALGSLIRPRGYLVLAANREAFATAYGATNLVFDTFDGVLQPDGETLTLVQPGGDETSELEVAKVRYGSAAPWPEGANGTGSSLQLIDTGQDNWRVGNWAVAPATPGTANRVATALPAFPPLWINEVQADNLTGITNRAGRQAPWIEIYNPSANVVSLDGLWLSNDESNPAAWAFPSGASINAGEFKVLFADGQTSLSTPGELHTSFVLSSSAGSVVLSRLYNGQSQVLDYLDYTNLAPDHSYGSLPNGQSFARQEFAAPTPGAANAAAAAVSFVAYAAPDSVYMQDFDGLPDPGAASVNSENPVTIDGSIYSLANPFAFDAPVLGSGDVGGLGIGQMAGWHGLAQLEAKFGASDGDQTTGGAISFGLPSSSNRALGLLATSSTGPTAFGVRFINQTAQGLTAINVQVTGELWRQSDFPKTLECSYYIEPTGTAPFSTNQTAFLPGLDVSFPVDAAAAGGVAVDGTDAINQVNLGVFDQAITRWPPGAALWLAWRMVDATGKAQGLAIDNLSFSASVQAEPAGLAVSIQATTTNLVLSWPGMIGEAYQLEYKDDLGAPGWTPLGNPLIGAGALLSFTNSTSGSAQRFYRLRAQP